MAVKLTASQRLALSALANGETSRDLNPTVKRSLFAKGPISLQGKGPGGWQLTDAGRALSARCLLK